MSSSKKTDQSSQELLHKFENFMSMLVDAVTEYAIFALDLEGHVLTWNKGAERLKGYRADEIIGHHFSEFYTAEDKERHHPEEELKIARATGKSEDEGWRVRKDGSKFWASVVINTLIDEKGAVIGFSKVTRDLTEKMKAENKLRESEERLRLMIAGVKDYAIFMLDPSGKVASWNDEAQKIKQYLPEEIIGTYFGKFYGPEDLANGKPEYELKVAAQTGRFEDEGWRIKKDGTRFWANVIITAVRNSEGKLLGFSKITRDLSERKIAEEKLKASNENLEEKIRERTSQLERAVKSRDEFLSIASHELNTPLTTLKLQTQLRKRYLKTKGMEFFTPDKLEHMIEDDENQVNRLARLVNDMLDISRIHSGKLSIQPVLVNLGAVIEDILERFKPQLQGQGIEVNLIQSAKIEGLWDRFRIEQVFINLLTNAMKYGSNRPIKVELSTDVGQAIIKVQDQGRGIAPEDQDRIFMQFERAVSINEVSGLGLGLYIIKQIIEAHKGSISVESKLGKGSIFTVKLPL